MSIDVEPLSSFPRLRGLLEVTRLVRDERDLTRLVDGIAETISESLGWNTVAINLYRPAEGDFEVTTVYGNESARAALLGVDTARRCVDSAPGRALPAPRRLLHSERRGGLGRPSLAHPGSFDELGSGRLAPGGRSDRPDARRRRDAARRRIGRRAAVRAPADGRGARRAGRLRRARDRGLRGRPGRRRGRARPGGVAPAARRLRLARRPRHRRLSAWRTWRAAFRRRSSSRRSPSAS